MKRRTLPPLAGTCLAASLTMATAYVAISSGGADRPWGIDRLHTARVRCRLCSPSCAATLLRRTPTRQSGHQSRDGDMYGCAPWGHADWALPGVVRSRARRHHRHVVRGCLVSFKPRECIEGDQVLSPFRPLKPRKSPGTSSKVHVESGPPRVLVVGAGTRFLSAMSYYTIRLTNALAGRFAVAFIPMRQLIPTFLYPGRSRVGSMSTRLDYDPAVKVLDGIDWYWVPNLFRDLNSLRKVEA